MSEALEIRSEILMLARLLQREPETLSYLEAVPPEELRELRELVTERLFDADKTLERVAAASKLLPTGLTATLSARTFGPLLSARIAGLLEPERAIEVAAKLPPSFLADVALELDPRRASAVIAGIPPEQIAAVTAELVGRGEYVTMGQFVGHIGPEALRAAVAVMSERQLLQVAFVLEQKDGLDELVELLDPARLPGLIEAAAVGDMWDEALDLFARLSETCARQIATASTGLDDAALEALVNSAIEHDLVERLLTIAGQMPEQDLQLLQERLGALWQKSA